MMLALCRPPAPRPSSFALLVLAGLDTRLVCRSVHAYAVLLYSIGCIHYKYLNIVGRCKA